VGGTATASVACRHQGWLQKGGSIGTVSLGGIGDFWVENQMEESQAKERACAQSTTVGGNVGDLGTCSDFVWLGDKIRL
jgi:hypothetical protein